MCIDGEDTVAFSDGDGQVEAIAERLVLTEMVSPMGWLPGRVNRQLT